MEENSKKEENKVSERIQDISEHLSQLNQRLENIEHNSVLGKLIEGLASELNFHTNNIQDKSSLGLKDSFLFSGRYLEWFIKFTKKDTLLLEYLLEYQRNKIGYKLSSLEERMIRDTFMDFFIDEELEDTFEATILFTEIGFTEEPTDEIRRCVQSYNFLNVLKLASQIGRIMQGYESIMRSAEFYDKVIAVMSSYSQAYKKEKEAAADIANTVNATMALLYYQLIDFKYTVTIVPNVPRVQISFQKLVEIWTCILECMIKVVENHEKKDIKISVDRVENLIKIKFIVKCLFEKKSLYKKIDNIKQGIIVFKSSKSSIENFGEINNLITEYGGVIDLTPKKSNKGIVCSIDIPIN